MKYDFDNVVNRKNTDCEKWDYIKEEFGRDDLLPLWVADTDFSAPEAVLKAIHDKVDQGALGYPVFPDELYSSITGWFDRRHGWKVSNDSVCWAHGVISGLAFSILAYTKPGDGVIVQTPGYHNFFRVIDEAGRKLVRNPLIYKDGKFVMNLEELEKLVTPNCRMLVLCSPHNPVARVWTREELEALAELAVRKNMIIITDEIHQDIVFSDAHHTCLGSLPGMESRCVTITAPSKTFNIPGVKASVAIIPDETLRGQYVSVLERFHLNSLNILGTAAMKAAYTECDEWLDQLIAYLEKNRDYTEKFIKENMPKAHMDHPEGTFIFWIDFRGYGFNAETLNDFLVNKARVALSGGTEFGPEGDGFARINIGTNLATLKEALNRIAEALKKEFN